MEHEGMVSVGLVDDHLALQEGLEVMLSRRGCRVVGTAATAAEARALVEEHEPEVMVIDLNLPDEGGASLARSVRATRPQLGVIIYTGMTDDRALTDALECGAQGTVVKPSPLSELVDAIRAVRRGERYRDPALAGILAEASEDERVLSPRQREVLQLLARGSSGTDIAAELGISWETVRTHIRNAMAKLGAKTRIQATLAAAERHEIDSS